MDVTKAVNEIKAGKIEYRLDKTNIIHCPIGKVSFGKEQVGLKTLIHLWVLSLKRNRLRQRVSI